VTDRTLEPGKRIPLVNGTEYDYMRQHVPRYLKGPRDSCHEVKKGYRRRYRRKEREWVKGQNWEESP
jgi:hypothetical protein